MSSGVDSQALARARDLIDTPPDITTPSRSPRVARLFRRSVNRALSNHTAQLNLRLNALADALEEHENVLNTPLPPIEPDPQRMRFLETDATLVREIRAKFAAMQEAFGRLRGEIADGHDQVYARVAELEASYSAIVGHLEQLQASLQQAQDTMSAGIADVTHTAARLDSESVARPYMSDESALRVENPHGQQTLGFTARTWAANATYADFEDLFRGSGELIASRLKPYVPILRDHSPVLDVGCGRGELLGLLKTEGIEARGVDPDLSMVARTQALGLDVAALDSHSALKEVAAESLGAVISIQFVEHITPGEMRTYFQQSFDALRAGGLFVAETVNPHSAMALKAFWVDLTHVRPLYPESLLVLAREIGFDSAWIMFPAGTGDLDADLRACGEYAIVARKA